MYIGRLFFSCFVELELTLSEEVIFVSVLFFWQLDVDNNNNKILYCSKSNSTQLEVEYGRPCTMTVVEVEFKISNDVMKMIIFIWWGRVWCSLKVKWRWIKAVDTRPDHSRGEGEAEARPKRGWNGLRHKTTPTSFYSTLFYFYLAMALVKKPFFNFFSEP